ncbi:MAG TPA: elongation factor G [Woeseiaceae bacterium]|nr:elongation factor G [Woeseiaceae bacterium]
MTYRTADIRNVCLVGPAHAGKTQLTEALLHAGGSIARCGTVEQGDTVSDSSRRERQLGHSLHVSVCHFDHAGIHVNMIDTPGHRDLYGRALSVLPAVETAAVVIDAQNGIDSVTGRVMNAATALRLCRLIIVNKIDALDADPGGLVERIRAAFGPECLPINLPGAQGDVIDCYSRPSGAATAFGSVQAAHTQIIDQVVEVDDALMELYLEQGEELGPDQLHEPFEKALREGHLVPICFVSTKTGAGIPELLEIFERLLPNPMEGNPPTFLKGEGDKLEQVRVTMDPAQHVIAHVVMVNNDPYKGRLAVCRVHQGTIRPGMQLFAGNARKPVKVNQVLKLMGNELVRADAGAPGDICAIPRVEEACYDTVLHDSHDEDHMHLKSAGLPRPMFGLAIRPANDADVQKVSEALHSLQAEDPSLNVEHVATLNEIVLRGLGELHLRDVLDDIADRYGVRVETALPSIAYRETITAPAEGHHRHKKQSGGAGQFGEVFLRIEPLTRDTGFRFDSAVVGGAIPSQFIPAVETGVRQVMESGAIAGYPMQDIAVRVYDGKHHAVDSKEVAFIQAGRKAFLDAIVKAAPIVMEPIVDVTVTVPSACVGGVTGDLSAMRGMVSGTSVLPDNRIVVSGQAPLKEIQGYHSRLKSLSGGEGSFTMDFSHYAPVPEQARQELTAAFRR